MSYPERIICMTEETTETLYLLGEEDRIVGISGFTKRPLRARKEKPKISAFTSANIEKIVELEPDLVLGFSDLQADIAAELIRLGIQVHVFNQRTVSGIFSMMRMLGAMIGEVAKTEDLCRDLQAHVDEVAQAGAELPRRPRVYFEEWYDPYITAIGWVSELITIAGGTDVFEDLSSGTLARHRTIEEQQILEHAPDIMIGSWCGKMFKPDRVLQRDGWKDAVPALGTGFMEEIDSSIILQPGPAALTDGLDALHDLVVRWNEAVA